MTSSKNTSLIVAACAAALSFPTVGLSAVGKVLLVSGSATRDGTDGLALKAGDTLDAGDTIATGTESRLQLLMADGTRMALRAGSRVRIDNVVLPSSVRNPGASDGATAVASNLRTLLEGGFSANEPASAASELKTPMGTLFVRGAHYTAVLCRGDCAESTSEGLYLAVDRGTVTFEYGGRTLTRTGPSIDFIPMDGGEARSLANEPRDLPDAFPTASAAETKKVEQNLPAVSPLGRKVDLIDPQPAFEPRMSGAVAVPPTTTGTAFVASSTTLHELLTFRSASNLLQLDAPYLTSTGATSATYQSGTASLLDFGMNGASGIRWGRWSGGEASISTTAGLHSIDLSDASLHWIVGPAFEAPPVLPTSGTYHFVMSGGTSPSNATGVLGTLNGAMLTADFTAQSVSASLSLDINGYSWFAEGAGSLTSGSPRFDGAFTTVLIDGRIRGTGGFSGFLSAGARMPDQLSGAGLSYWLTGNADSFGTVSGVVAFVPGAPSSVSPSPVERDIAYAVGRIEGASLVGGVAANSRARLLFDNAGGLSRFDAPVPGAASGILSAGVSNVTITGEHGATGIRWGRWDGGAIDVTTPPGGSVSNDLTGQALHWITSNEYGSPPVIAQSGSATYTLVGNTNPSDTRGNIGVLGTATFEADFTNRFVSTEMTLNVGGFDWYASGQATFPIGGNRFEGTYDDVRIQNIARGQGTIHGFFTQPRVDSGFVPGAGLAFNLTDNAGQLGVISGVLAFEQGGQGSSVTPLSRQQRDIAMVAPSAFFSGPIVDRAAPADYALDDSFALTGMPGAILGTSTVAESDVSTLVMLRWGRWAGGDATLRNLANAQTQSIDLRQQSLHWIEGADTSSPPVMPTFGTATYALLGATAPTDRTGHVGILHNASLTADFTNQRVSAAFDITINNYNVVATGNGDIGAAAGLAAHQFSGNITNGTVSNSNATPQGSFSGFFSAPGATTPGAPGGAGLTYSIIDGNGVIDGAAAFRRP